MADPLKFGSAVMVDTCEGFGGPGTVIGWRDCPTSHYRVVLDDGSQPPFWAHDFEVTPLPVGNGYDSRPDTAKHVQQVRANLAKVVDDLTRRGDVHDLSKFQAPEKPAFDEFTPKLAASTYGSPEYEEFRRAMGPALDHHYAHNRHHPEFHRGGIGDMSLLDLLEMLCDWKAATTRHNDGDIRRSVEINQKRFGYSDELKQILLNTVSLLE
jgi:hypothetical protein